MISTRALRFSISPVVLALIIYVLPIVVRASQNELTSLLEARTLIDFEHQQTSAVQVRRAQGECAAELKARTLPRGCFQQLSLERRTNVNERRRLTRICRLTAEKSRSRLDLSSDSHDLPAECQTAITARLEDLRYADEDLHPETSVGRTGGPELE